MFTPFRNDGVKFLANFALSSYKRVIWLQKYEKELDYVSIFYIFCVLP